MSQDKRIGGPWIFEPHGMFGRTDPETERDDCITQARAAIAKAKGGAS